MKSKQTPNSITGVAAFRPTERSLPIALLRSREIVMAPIRKMLSETGLSEQKWRILRILDESGRMEQSQISKHACLLLPSLTRILRGMEADGFVKRQVDQLDRRRTLVDITTQGHDFILAHLSMNTEIFNLVETEFGIKDMEQLLDLLEKFQSLKIPTTLGTMPEGR